MTPDPTHHFTRAAALSCLSFIALLTAACGPSSGHSRAETRPDSAHVFNWDLAGALSKQGTCTSSADATQPSQIVPLRPGRYVLTMTATRGSHRGETLSGRLWLTPTSSEDESPSTHQRSPVNDTIAHPLFGATDFPFLRVGAPVVHTNWPTPFPTSLDPVTPGVLVTRQNWQTPDQIQKYALLIGTMGNLRAGQNDLDGPGIWLNVQRSTPTQFTGRWDNYGVIADGAGYFCATMVSQ